MAGGAAQKSVVAEEMEVARPDHEVDQQALEHGQRLDRAVAGAPLVLEAKLLKARFRIDRAGEIRVLLDGTLHHQSERVGGGEGEKGKLVGPALVVGAELRVVVAGSDREPEIFAVLHHGAKNIVNITPPSGQRDR